MGRCDTRHGVVEAQRSWKSLASELILNAGGVEKLARCLKNGSRTERRSLENLLKQLVLIWLGQGDIQDNERFIPRVCSKLRSQLRNLGRAKYPPETKHTYFLNAIDSRCKKTLKEKSGWYVVQDVPTKNGVAIDNLPAPAPVADPAGESEEGALWCDFKSTMLSEDAALYALIALFECAPDEVPYLQDKNGKFDAAKIARKLDLTREEARGLVSRLDSFVAGYKKKRLTKMKQTVPRPFREVYRRLVILAASALDSLPDAELRSELFDLSRALSSSFDREHLYAEGIRPLTKPQFEGTIDLLLGEHRTAHVGEHRLVLERLMQAIRNVREALEAGDVKRTFMYTPILILDAARMQPPSSPSRLQILVAYTYTLRLTDQYNEYISANQAIIRECDAIVRKEGARVLDLPPEFERGATLRRVRTYAALNELVGLFYFRFTTAREARFLVKDYRGLASLPGRMKELMQRDPQVEFIANELLVASAHLARAAYNAHRTAEGPADRQLWKTERDARRRELRALVTKHFFDVELGRPDPRRLWCATTRGEGRADERTFDVILEVLHDQKELVRAIRAERVAAGAHVGPA